MMRALASLEGNVNECIVWQVSYVQVNSKRSSYEEFLERQRKSVIFCKMTGKPRCTKITGGALKMGRVGARRLPLGTFV